MLIDMTWAMASALLVSMVLAIALGANDVGNFFGTSVGANVLTMKSAFFLATVFEIAGAVLLGEKVSDTIWKNIIDYRVFKDQEKCLMLGNLSALIGCSIWMLIATRFRLPVSATHSIVGATVGYAMVVHGSSGVNWVVFAAILGSWLASPVLAGILSMLLFHLRRRFLSSLERKPAMVVLRWLPATCAITVMINVFSILMHSRKPRLSVWYYLMITFSLGAIVALVVWFFMVPKLKQKVIELENSYDQTKVNISEQDVPQSPTSVGDIDSDKKVEMFIENYLKNPDMNSASDKSNKNLLTQQDSSRHAVPMTDVAMQAFLPQDSSKFFPCGLKCFPVLKHAAVHQHAPEKYITPMIRSGSMGTFRRDVDRRSFPFGRMASLDLSNVRKPEYDPLLDRRRRSEMTFNRQVISPGYYSEMDVDTEERFAFHLSQTTDQLNYDMDDNLSANSIDPASHIRPVLQDPPSVAKIFSVLQIMSALFGSFTHGFNDVSNAIAPLVAAWNLWVTELNFMGARTPLWILLYGGTFIGVGIWLWGDRTIKTIGQDITSISPSSGFVIELCSAIAVLIATNLGLPVSSTHCKVGSVVCVGRMSGKDAVNWKLVRNIAIAWAATFPVTGIISAAVMTILRKAVPM